MHSPHYHLKFQNNQSTEHKNQMQDSFTLCMFSGVTGASTLIRVKKQQMPVRLVSGGVAIKSLNVFSPSTIPGNVC